MHVRISESQVEQLEQHPLHFQDGASIAFIVRVAVGNFIAEHRRALASGAKMTPKKRARGGK